MRTFHADDEPLELHRSKGTHTEPCMSPEDPASETAKAVQEVAKTTAKAIDAGQRMGSFLAKYVGGPLEQAMGIWEDKLKYARWERQLRLMKKGEEVMREAGLPGPTRQIPLKLAVPLLQGASLEEDDYLQDRWVNLLVNAANKQSGIDLQRSFIDILERLTPLEARILERIYTNPDIRRSLSVTILTGNLPDSVAIAAVEDHAKAKLPSEPVRVALANLTIMGCLQVERSMDGRELFGLALPRLIGKLFVDACTLQTKQPQRGENVE